MHKYSEFKPGPILYLISKTSRFIMNFTGFWLN